MRVAVNFPIDVGRGPKLAAGRGAPCVICLRGKLPVHYDRRGCHVAAGGARAGNARYQAIESLES